MRIIVFLTIALLLGGCASSPFPLVHPENKRYEASCPTPGLLGLLGLKMDWTHCTKGYRPS